MIEQRVETLDKALQLTADQKQQIKDIYAKEATAAKDSKGAGKDRRAALMKVRDEVRAVLTPEQQVKFDKMATRGGGTAGRPRKGAKN